MPDESGSFGGAGWTPPPMSGGIPNSPPPVLGTEQLQKAIDKFDAAVEKLTRLYNQASGGGFGGSSNGGGGFGGGSSQNAGGAGFLGGKYNIGHFAEEAAGIVGFGIPLRGPMRSAYGNWGGMVGGGSGYQQQQQGGSSGFAGQYSFGGGPAAASPATGSASPSAPLGSSGGAPPTFNGQSMSPSSGGASGGGGFLARSGMGSMASGVLSLMAGFTGYGKASLPNMVAMSSMQQQGTLLAPSSVANFGVYGDRMRGAAFGSNNTNPNNFAMGTQDAAQGYGFLQQMAGSGIASSTSTGRFGLGAAASFAGTNPDMSYASAAGLAQQMAMPSMSLRMTQAGYRATPMKLGGGGANSFGSVIGSMMQRWYPGQKWVKPQNMAAALMPGQVGNQNLAALGYSPDQVQALSSTMEAYNQVGYRSHMGASQIQNLFQKAQGGNASAVGTLNKYGVTESVLSKIKRYDAQGTMNQSDVYDSFTSGLNGTIGVLTRFKQILNNIVNIPGINQLVGGGGGVMGTLGHFAGDFKNIGEGAFGLGALGYGASKMLGGSGGGIGGIANGLLGKLTGGGLGGGMLGMFGLMDPEVTATLAAGQYGITSLFSGGNPSAGNPRGNLGSSNSGGNGRWSTNTMNVTANVVNVHGPGAGGSKGNGASPSTGGGNGGSGSGGGGILGDLDRLAAGGSLGKMLLNRILGTTGKQPGPGGGARSPGSVSPATSSSRPSVTSSISSQARTAVGDAETQLGVPYVWGGQQPGVGFDCSGLTQWAYAQAGVRLPRTSQTQWAALKGRRSIDPRYAQEGDLVFMAGSDGTADSPGHVGMMVSSKTLIEAPQTGENVKEIAYNPADWSHAARPVGSMGTSAAATATAAAGGSGGTAGGMAGSGGGGSSNSVSEADNVTSALGGGSSGVVTGGGSYSSNGGSTSSAGGSGGKVSTSGGGTPAANKSLAQRMMKQMYGWSGAQWTNGLLPLWMQESGFNQHAQNPTSTAYGIPQFLDTTWGPYGPKTSDAGLQEKYGLEYIHDRYGNPVNAMSHERQFNWYADGTSNARRGVAILGERGPEAVFLRGGEKVATASQTAQMFSGSGGGSLGGVSVTLEFAPGSIVIQQGDGVNSVQAASNSAREIVSKVTEMLHDESIYAAIRNGQKG